MTQLLTTLPERFTYSDRIKNFPSELRQSILRERQTGQRKADAPIFARVFNGQIDSALNFDSTDGLRITLANDEVVHIRASGNAPELRCYTEADSYNRAKALNQLCMQQMNSWKQ